MEGSNTTGYTSKSILDEKDREEISKLLYKAKGSRRTMDEFARECGTNQYKFSRIMQLKQSRPLSQELINKIADKAEDLSSEEREDLRTKLLIANGMLPKKTETQSDNAKETEGSADKSRVPFYERRRQQRERVKNLITNAITRRRRLVMVFPDGWDSMEEYRSLGGINHRRLNDVDRQLSARFQFTLHVQGEDPLYWIFSYVLGVKDQMERYNVNIPSQAKNLFFEHYARFFLKDAWEPENDGHTVKYTFVYSEPESYEAIKEELSHAVVNRWISILLVDFEKGDVVEEFELRSNRHGMFASIFDEEPEPEKDPEQDMHGEIWSDEDI